MKAVKVADDEGRLDMLTYRDESLGKEACIGKAVFVGKLRDYRITQYHIVDGRYVLLLQ